VDELLEYPPSHLEPITPYKCCYVHDTPCLYEFIRKVLTVCRIGVKYYIFFHIVPLILRIKKARSPHEKGRVALRTLIEYCKSILFMGFLVGLSKGALCIKNNLSLPFDGTCL
jgi:di/tricarboxylate transporter